MKRYETERLVLRELEAGDSDLLSDYLRRNRNFLREWEPLRDASFFTDESVKAVMEEEKKSCADRSALHLYLFNKGEERIIGKVSLTNIVYGVFQSCFLGYKLDEAEINQGKITEALKRLIDIAFTEYGLHRIEANIVLKNIRSIRVIKKLNFQEEGLSRKYLKINGTWEDHLHFVLLNEEVE